MDQAKASENTDGTAAGHPAGEVRLPRSRGQVARAMALAGIVLGIGAVAEAGTLGAGTTTGP